jgi:hypothetical protein
MGGGGDTSPTPNLSFETLLSAVVLREGFSRLQLPMVCVLTAFEASHCCRR